ncbi:orotidine-5'-phosphate decarboxylase [Rubeoparvulum massiliense]|uniref:orotidine-5'-phosphate decarboxylase n=1 Tax=Rubeoparvulum massiliense TaxID=1631346 RepID=UPI00065E7BC7|nr:orotidine-5'-phosphate decarboxylase [Rubeoparvulum massiliense]
MQPSWQERIYVACDFPTQHELWGFLDRMEGEVKGLKIGMQLFYREGLPLVEKLATQGYKLFLDLKLFDIPNTVRLTMKNMAQYPIEMVNVHAMGGRAMLEAAREGLEAAHGSHKPYLLGVTLLTSMDQESMRQNWLHALPLPKMIQHLSQLVWQSGLDGVVCSPWEAKEIKSYCSPNFLTVTPGIRPAGISQDDQKRSATPNEARQLGADYLVVGRPITMATDPLAAYHTILEQFKGGQEDE